MTVPRPMQRILFLFFIFSSFISHSQIVGKVSNTNGEALSYVNIYLENTYSGTTSNDEGNFELNFSKPGAYTIVFQFLGFKKLVKKINITSFPHILNVLLEEELVSLDQVVLSNKSEDPAYRIIRETIAQRKENLAKISEYTADFYSRGLWKLKAVPLKIMGQEVGDLDGLLDTTRSGIVYLSETISKISYRQPNDFRERIIASKVSVTTMASVLIVHKKLPFHSTKTQSI